MCNSFFYVVIFTTTSDILGTFVFSHYEQVYKTQKVCISGPTFIKLFFLALVGTTTSQNIRQFFNILYVHYARAADGR